MLRLEDPPMFDRLTRRGLLGRLLAGLLALLRPGAAGATPACPHPAHQALCAARRGREKMVTFYARYAVASSSGKIAPPRSPAARS